MDPIKNPFSPGAGSPPPELVGRDPILEQARILLGRVKQKKPEKSMLLTGLRGVGKTVLLNEIERLAKANKYRTLGIEAHEDKPLGEGRRQKAGVGLLVLDVRRVHARGTVSRSARRGSAAASRRRCSAEQAAAE